MLYMHLPCWAVEFGEKRIHDNSLEDEKSCTQSLSSRFKVLVRHLVFTCVDLEADDALVFFGNPFSFRYSGYLFSCRQRVFWGDSSCPEYTLFIL